jgi:hypothetical protein
VPGGNIPASSASVELKLTFKEGGAADFHSKFEQIKERLQQVVSSARESNLASQPHPHNSNLSQVDLENVHLDQLPSYQDSGRDRMASPTTRTAQTPGTVDDLLDLHASPSADPVEEPRRTESPEPHVQPPSDGPPTDAPPGYEEVQQNSIQAELDRRLSQPLE